MQKFLQSVAAFILIAVTAQAQTPNYHCLAQGPFTQDWTNIGLITASDNWSAPELISIRGFKGDAGALPTATDPNTIVADENTTPFVPITPVYDVNHNQTNPVTYNTGGITELEITNPTIAFKGSGSADLPFIKIYLCTVGASTITVNFDLLDLDSGPNNSISAVSIQARIGNSGNYTVLGSYADVTDGPNLIKPATNVSFVLPAGCNNKEKVELRIMTNNAASTDEFIGIDNINISAATTTPTTAIPTAVGTYTGNYECANGITDGYTHYYNNNATPTNYTDDLLLLSINKNTTGVITNATEVTVGVLSSVANLSTAGFVTNPNGFYTIPRYWQVTPTTQPTGSPAVRFYYTNADLAALNTTLAALPMPGVVTTTNATVYKFTGAINPDPSTGHIGGDGTNFINLTYAATATPASHVQTEFTVTNFSGGSVGGGGGGAGKGPLPVVYLAFVLKNHNNQANLLWTTASETNNAYFVVERSQNAINFNPIAKVEGNGTTNQATNYTFTDANPIQGISYYRLRQTDFDGKYTYSKILTCNISADKSFAILPNIITDGTFEIQTASKYTNITITDVYGKNIANMPYAPSYNINNLPAGIYFVRRNDSPGAQKIVKQ